MGEIVRERFYLYWSLAFDRMPYDIPEIKRLVKEAGGLNVRTARQFGWSNQPRVVTWSVEYNASLTVYPNEAIEDKLYELEAFGDKGSLPCPIVCRKDW